MLVARISEVLFHSQPEVHTVAYNTRAQEFVRSANACLHNWELALGENESEAVNNLRLYLAHRLDMRDLRHGDFSFRISHSNVVDGMFHNCSLLTTVGSAFDVVEE